MRITYDPKYDILYLKLGEAEKVISKEMDEDITMDLDSEGKMVGIEILSASEHVNLSTLLPVEVKRQALR
jgi:uncharacterized protein YuzE